MKDTISLPLLHRQAVAFMYYYFAQPIAAVTGIVKVVNSGDELSLHWRLESFNKYDDIHSLLERLIGFLVPIYSDKVWYNIQKFHVSLIYKAPVQTDYRKTPLDLKGFAIAGLLSLVRHVLYSYFFVLFLFVKWCQFLGMFVINMNQF